MRLLLTLFCLMIWLPASAQFGFQTAATLNQGSNLFITGIGDIDGMEFEPGAELSLNYWFRLPKQRVEFLPTVYFGSAKQREGLLRLKEYGAQFKINFYPFDFSGDCDCPTFGKQGPQLQKGFFIQASAGYAFYNLDTPDDSTFSTRSRENGISYGGALGLDIGLSNLLTLTPIAGVRRGTADYTGFVTTDVNGQNPEELKSKLNTFYAGLQLSFRFDHKKY